MELPAKKPQPTFRTLEEIRQRKDELSDQLLGDSKQFSTLWSQIFVKQKDSSRGEYLVSIVNNSITAIDAFILMRKLLKNYNRLFGKKGKR